jgi:serine/threonine protein kinase
MEPTHWAFIQDAYYSALSIPRSERDDFVARVCHFDPALIKEVTSLLEAGDEAADFLEPPIFELGLRIFGSANSTRSENAAPAASLHLIGSTIDGRFLIEKELGRGGMGIVYFARDRRLLNRPTVVKVLLDKSLQNEHVVRNFQKEKEALARVDHPGVANILDAGELPDGKPYIVMQYVEGISLRDAINAEPAGMDLERAAAIIKGIGGALSAVHQKKIYHRDLKPENIMLQRLSLGEEQVKILDFGIAKVRESLVAPSTITGAATLGTIVYMSPEQLRGERVTAASDIYSFAVIAYEIVTGRRPFNPDNVAHLADMQRQGVRAKPADLRPRLPDQAQAIILSGLTFDPTERYREAREFGDELSRALVNDEEPVRPGHFAPDRASADSVVSSSASTSSKTPANGLESPHAFQATVGEKAVTTRKKWIVLVAVGILLLGAAIVVYWINSQRPTLFGETGNTRSTTSLPHRTLNYSLTVQKMRDGMPYKDPFESSGQEIFENGYKFRLNVSSRQAGYLYVFNEGAAKNDQTNFTILYPTPATNDGSAKLEQNQDVQTNWNTFGGETGTERFWIVWSAAAVTELEIARHEAFKNKEGALTDVSMAKKLSDFLAQNSDPQLETTKDTANQRTTVRVNGAMLVKLVELEHR